MISLGEIQSISNPVLNWLPMWFEWREKWDDSILVCLTLVFFLVIPTSKFAEIIIMICIVVIKKQTNKKHMPLWEAHLRGQMPTPVTITMCDSAPIWNCRNGHDLYSWSNQFWTTEVTGILRNLAQTTFLFMTVGHLFLLSPPAPSFGFLGPTQRLHSSRFFLTHLLLFISYWFPRRLPAVLFHRLSSSCCISLSTSARWLSFHVNREEGGIRWKLPSSLSLFLKHWVRFQASPECFPGYSRCVLHANPSYLYLLSVSVKF